MPDGISTSSVDTSVLKAGDTEIIIETTAIKAIPRYSSPPPQVPAVKTPYVVEKLDGESFTVKIDQAVGTDTSFVGAKATQDARVLRNLAFRSTERSTGGL